MPRYMVERTFADGLRIPVDAEGARACGAVIANNAKSDVTWIHSYVSEDLHKSFCVYDGPTAQAVRETAERNNLPVDNITAVSVLDPYFYHG